MAPGQTNASTEPTIVPDHAPPAATQASGEYYSLADAMTLATRHQAAGRLREAEAVLRRILNVAPQHAPALHLLGIIAHQAGQTDTAARLVGEAITRNPDVGLYHTNLCEILRQQKDCARAIEHGRRGAELDPDSATAHSNLGVAHYDAEDYDAAEACQRRALAIEPHLPQALNNLGSICRQREDHDQAIAYYRETLAAAPNHVEALNNLGALLTETEQPEEAHDVLMRAIKLNPGYPEAHRNIGSMFLQEEDYEKAAAAFTEALRHRPQFVAAMVGLAAVRRHQRDFEPAERLLDEALAVEGDNVAARIQKGLLYGDMGFPERAAAIYDEAIAQAPEVESIHVAKGHLLTETGDMAGAEAALNRALEINPDSVGAHLAMVQLKKVRPGDPAFVALQAELGKTGAGANTRRLPLYFGLGKCYDDSGDYEQAIEHFLAGCRLKRARLDYDPETNRRHVDDIMQAYDARAIERLGGGGHDSELPVFVLGMPRSGTTLTEQIIASHSQAHGAGELPDLSQLAGRSPLTGEHIGFPDALADLTTHELGALGEKYASGLRQRNATAARITDKMPANFFYIGLIHLMLPRARIVHIRRNAVDTCLSNLTKLFRTGQGHTYDLRELGLFYVNYARLMEHWRAVLPPGSFFELRYEDLVADTESHARALIDYCGLPWEPQCLEFHKTERSIRTASVTQVRQPIYKSSVARWKRYEKSLGPLLETLGDLVEA